MKKKFLMLFMSAFIATGALFAQNLNENVQQETARMKAEKLRNELNLNEDQRIKVYDIYLKHAQQTDLTPDMDKDREAIKNHYKNNKSTIMNEIDGVLTPAQRTKLQNWKED